MGTSSSAWSRSRSESYEVVWSRLKSSGVGRSRLESFGVGVVWSRSFPGQNRSESSRSESFGVVRSRPEPPRVVWSHPESSGVVWSHSESESSRVGVFRVIVVRSSPKSPGAAQSRLESSGVVWGRLKSSGVGRSRLESFGVGVIWSRSFPGQNRSESSEVVRMYFYLWSGISFRCYFFLLLCACTSHTGLCFEGWLRPTQEDYDSSQFQMTPDGSGRLRTTLNDSEWFWTTPDDSDSRRLQTTPDDSGRLRMTPDESDSRRIRNWFQNCRSRIGIN